MLTAVFALTLGTQPPAEPDWLGRQFVLMGTRGSIEVQAADRGRALELSEVAIRALAECDDLLSTWRDDTELAGLRRLALGESVAVSAELRPILESVFAHRTATEGAFEPVIGGLVDLWRLRDGGRGTRPGSLELGRALAGVGLAGFAWDAGRLTRRHPGAWIDAGAFGKGAALDHALAAVAALDPRARCVIDLGGQLAWRLGQGRREFDLADPRARDRSLARISVAGCGSLATSGNSERGIMVDGVPVGHLLDPRSGQPARAFGSLTVLAERALDADCLATGLYVLGPARALAFARRCSGVEVVVCETATELRIRASKAIAQHLALTTNQPHPFEPNPK